MLDNHSNMMESSARIATGTGMYPCSSCSLISSMRSAKYMESWWMLFLKLSSWSEASLSQRALSMKAIPISLFSSDVNCFQVACSYKVSTCSYLLNLCLEHMRTVIFSSFQSPYIGSRAFLISTNPIAWVVDRVNES